MFILSFHGGSGKNALNNLHVYKDDGSAATPDKLLAPGGGAPDLCELRGFVWRPEGLYVVNANQNDSQLLCYKPQSAPGGQYTFSAIVAGKATVSGIGHPFDVTFDASGNIYLSSQDTNVVTALDENGNALPVAPYLQQTYAPPPSFPEGTFVASSAGKPPVPSPQGLQVTFDRDGNVTHSVRGVLWTGNLLLVADEPGNAVKVYDASGKLQGQIQGKELAAPVHLRLQRNTLYISGGNDTICTCPIPPGKSPSELGPATKWLDKHLHSPAGMCFDSAGDFYVAERKRREVRKFDPSGNYLGKFISNLPDEPEFIVYQAELPR